MTSDQRSLRSSVLAARYFSGLLAVVVFFGISMFLIVREGGKEGQSCIALVNLSGRQRMFVQRTAFLSLRLLHAEAGEMRRRLRQELEETVQDMEKFHDFLVASLSQKPGFFQRPPSQVRGIYFSDPHQLEKHMRHLIIQVRRFLADPEENLSDDNVHFLAVNRLSGELMKPLDAAVLEWQDFCIHGTGRSQVAAFIFFPLFGILSAMFILIKR